MKGFGLINLFPSGVDPGPYIPLMTSSKAKQSSLLLLTQFTDISIRLVTVKVVKLIDARLYPLCVYSSTMLISVKVIWLTKGPMTVLT